MAKYFPHEDLFRCRNCDIEARRSEFYDDCHVLMCPNCDSKAFHKKENCDGKLNHVYDHAELVRQTPIYGVLSFRYMGYGKKELPEITIEDDRWEPDMCDDCHEFAIIHTTRIFDGANSVGIETPHMMLGLDEVSGGTAVVLPFSSLNRVFIDGKEQDITELFNETDQMWEYFV